MKCTRWSSSMKRGRRWRCVRFCFVSSPSSGGQRLGSGWRWRNGLRKLLHDCRRRPGQRCLTLPGSSACVPNSFTRRPHKEQGSTFFSLALCRSSFQASRIRPGRKRCGGCSGSRSSRVRCPGRGSRGERVRGRRSPCLPRSAVTDLLSLLRIPWNNCAAATEDLSRVRELGYGLFVKLQALRRTLGRGRRGDEGPGTGDGGERDGGRGTATSVSGLRSSVSFFGPTTCAGRLSLKPL